MFGFMNGGFYAPYMGPGAPFLSALPEPGRRKSEFSDSVINRLLKTFSDATRENTAFLKDWLNSNRKNPYPTKGQKINLATVN